jgi:hypothetical protein
MRLAVHRCDGGQIVLRQRASFVSHEHLGRLQKVRSHQLINMVCTGVAVGPTALVVPTELCGELVGPVQS